LISRIRHLILLRKIDPELQSPRIGFAFFIDRDFGMDDSLEFIRLLVVLILS
jgi:hypothetical protein